jgi:hypothetical protein
MSLMNPDEKLAQWMEEREAREASHARATDVLAAGSDIWKLLGAGGAVALVLVLCFAPWHGTGNSRATQVTDPNAKFLSEYQTELARHRELGSKLRLTQAEQREYLILDGRLGVKEGILSKTDYERQTGEKY